MTVYTRLIISVTGKHLGYQSNIITSITKNNKYYKGINDIKNNMNLVMFNIVPNLYYNTDMKISLSELQIEYKSGKIIQDKYTDITELKKHINQYISDYIKVADKITIQLYGTSSNNAISPV